MHVTGKGKYRGWDLTPETVDQIWAEAISIYKDGEELYLNTLASMAEKSATINLHPSFEINAVRINSDSTFGVDS